MVFPRKRRPSWVPKTTERAFETRKTDKRKREENLYLNCALKASWQTKHISREGKKCFEKKLFYDECTN